MASSPERVLPLQPVHPGSSSGSAAWWLEGTLGHCSSGPRFLPLCREGISGFCDLLSDRVAGDGLTRESGAGDGHLEEGT